jgi:hypothetical protein
MEVSLEVVDAHCRQQHEFAEVRSSCLALDSRCATSLCNLSVPLESKSLGKDIASKPVRPAVKVLVGTSLGAHIKICMVITHAISKLFCSCICCLMVLLER